MPSAAPHHQRDAYGPVGRSAWLDIDWRAHRRPVEVEGRRLGVIDIGAGDGSPLVFLHGLSGCWQNWLENIPFFAADRRVIALDLPGFGESELPAEAISVTGYARTVDVLCETLAIDRAVVVGNSMGGFVAAEMAIRFPHRVDRLCLVAPAGLSMEFIRSERRRGWRPRLENLMFFSLAALAVRSDIVFRRPRLRRMLMTLVAAHPERLPSALLAEQMRSSGKPPGFDGALEAMTRYPIRDRLVPVGDATEFEWLIDDSRRVIYPDTGHLAMLERPQRFNDDLAAFLERPGDRRPATGFARAAPVSGPSAPDTIRG